MNREQFVCLPASVALGILWDAFPGLGTKLANVEPPKLARPPKYDQVIFRKDGVTYASEYDVEGLRFWRKRSAANGDPKYAEQNAKTTKALDYWIEWRLIEPVTCWTGERNREQVTARPPSGKPELYSRKERTNDDVPPAAAPNFDGDDGFDDDDDIPFIFCVIDEPEERWWKRPVSSAIP